MNIEITTEQITQWMEETRKEKILSMLDQMIKYFREQESQHPGGKGLAALKEMKEQGYIDYKLYEAIKPAVQYYTTPYKIVEI